MQLEWKYLQRTVSGVGTLIGPIEEALREKLFTTLFGREEINANFRKILVHLSAVPHRLNSTELSREEFRDNLCLRYGLMPEDIPATCDIFGKKCSIEHALSCPMGGLVLEKNNNAAKEWGDLGARALVPGAFTYEQKINSSTVQGERNGARAQQEGGEADIVTDTVGEAQRGRGRTVNGAARLTGQPGHVVVSAESRADVSSYGFWNRGTTTMFDIRIVNLDAGSYLHMTPEKALAKTEKEKKDLYLQACLERRSTFTPIVYSADGIPGTKALAAQKRLAALLSYKLKREYFKMCGFVRARMSLAIVRSNSLLLHGPRDKEAHIQQRSELTDGAVMALLAPWHG